MQKRGAHRSSYRNLEERELQGLLYFVKVDRTIGRLQNLVSIVEWSRGVEMTRPTHHSISRSRGGWTLNWD